MFPTRQEIYECGEHPLGMKLRKTEMEVYFPLTKDKNASYII